MLKRAKELKVGLQLYSIKGAMQVDVEGTLIKVKEMGYDYVEFAGYYGYSADEIRGMLDRCKLECVSVHQGYEVFIQNKRENVRFLKTIGAKYCAIPSMDRKKHKGAEAFDCTIKDLIKVGKTLSDEGIKLLYHNHEFEFERFENKFLLDWLFESIEPNLLQTEIDTCWVRYAGYDPSEYIRKYAGRCPIVHLKDFSYVNVNGSGSVYTEDNCENKIYKDKSNVAHKTLGEGILDFPSILKACVDSGVEFVIVEQNPSFDILHQMESVRKSLNYLKSLGI